MIATSRRFASLFCGCGAFDLGFVQNGFKLVAAFDNDPVAVATHRQNLGNVAELRDLATSIPIESLKDLDLLLAGPPCQGFSTVGKRDENDPRNSLLLSVGTIAALVRPKIVVVENVRGVTSGGHRKYWDGLRQLLRAGGYKTAEICCEGPKLGIAQLRTRVVMIAWRTEREAQILNPQVPVVTLREVLANVDHLSNHEVRPLAPVSLSARIAKYIRPGQKLTNVRGGPRSVHTWQIPEVFGRTSKMERQVLDAIRVLRRRDRVRDYGDADPVRLSTIDKYVGASTAGVIESLLHKGYVKRSSRRYDLTHTFNGKYQRLDWEQPSPTVDTKFGDPRFVLHPSENRGFTVREAARIQGIPDSFIFSGPEKSQYRMVGNAVPPPFSCHLADLVLSCLD